MQRGIKELDVKITSVSGVVEETKLLIVDGVKGIKSNHPSEELLMVDYDRNRAEKDHGLVEPCKSSGNPCCYFKKA